MGSSLTRDSSDGATVLSSSTTGKPPFSAESMSLRDSNLPNPDSDSIQSDSAIDAKSEDVPSDQSGSAGNRGEEEEEEEGECGFCLFMKAGGCRESFIDWEKCVEEGEKNKEDIVEKCGQVTVALKKCMEAHSDYYEPILKAEKDIEQQAIIELEKENANEEASPSASVSASDKK